MASATARDFTYRYPFASYVGTEGSQRGLTLATCDLRRGHPHFFSGKLREPRAAAELLLVLCEVVRTHFFEPRPANLDPIVTSSPDVLRFEGFSGCCGVYARVDLAAEAFDREIAGRGTTNVDFNSAMRRTLGRLREGDEAWLRVGIEGVELGHADETIVEKKVKLPLRWLKGLSEVQAYQPRLELRLEVPAAEVRRFLRSLPSGKGPARTSYVVQTGPALRLTQIKSPRAIPLNGTRRVRVLEPLLATAGNVRIWVDDDARTSAWEVQFPTCRLFLMLSPELYRGFSGEGQILESLAGSSWQEALPYVQAQLAGQSQIDSGALADKLGLNVAEVDAALAVLGSRGLAGFDVSTGRYFHRVLPFDLGDVAALQPRLKGSQKLVAEDQVKILNELGGGAFDVSVAGTNVTHHVRLRPDGDRCTCPWYSKHQGRRGPCKHVLAARILIKQRETENEEEA